MNAYSCMKCSGSRALRKHQEGATFLCDLEQTWAMEKKTLLIKSSVVDGGLSCCCSRPPQLWMCGPQVLMAECVTKCDTELLLCCQDLWEAGAPIVPKLSNICFICFALVDEEVRRVVADYIVSLFFFFLLVEVHILDPAAGFTSLSVCSSFFPPCFLLRPVFLELLYCFARINLWFMCVHFGYLCLSKQRMATH